VAPRIITISTVDEANNVVLTPEQMLGGVLLRNTNGANREDIPAPASDLIAALGGADNVPQGTSFTLHVRNNSGSPNTWSLSEPTGYTAYGYPLTPLNNSQDILFVVLNPHTPQIAYFPKGAILYED
jgi:hypothetical protein